MSNCDTPNTWSDMDQHIANTWPTSAKPWPKQGQIWPTPHNCYRFRATSGPISGQFESKHRSSKRVRPTLGHKTSSLLRHQRNYTLRCPLSFPTSLSFHFAGWQNFDNIWADSAEFGPKLAISAPRVVKLGRLCAKFGHLNLTVSGQIWVTIGRVWSTSAKHVSAGFGFISATFPPDSAKFGRLRRDLVRVGQKSANIPRICSAQMPERSLSKAA